jgi:hypothetical protein
MATRRKGESEAEFHQRVSAYMRSYNQRRNDKAKAQGYKSYGQKRYRTQTKPKLALSELNRFKTWRRATRGTIPPQYVAGWYRRGLLKRGKATPNDVRARANFLAYAELRREGVARPSRRQIEAKAGLGSKILGRIAQGRPDLKYAVESSGDHGGFSGDIYGDSDESDDEIETSENAFYEPYEDYDYDEPFFDWDEWREDYEGAS